MAGSPKLEGSRDGARGGILPHAVANVCTDMRPGMTCVRGREPWAGLGWADDSRARQPAPSSWAPSHSQGGEGERAAHAKLATLSKRHTRLQTDEPLLHYHLGRDMLTPIWD